MPENFHSNINFFFKTNLRDQMQTNLSSTELWWSCNHKKPFFSPLNRNVGGGSCNDYVMTKCCCCCCCCSSSLFFLLLLLLKFSNIVCLWCWCWLLLMFVLFLLLKFRNVVCQWELLLLLIVVFVAEVFCFVIMARSLILLFNRKDFFFFLFVNCWLFLFFCFAFSLSWSVLFILFYFILFYFILFYFILFFLSFLSFFFYFFFISRNFETVEFLTMGMSGKIIPQTATTNEFLPGISLVTRWRLFSDLVSLPIYSIPLNPGVFFYFF